MAKVKSTGSDSPRMVEKQPETTSIPKQPDTSDTSGNTLAPSEKETKSSQQLATAKKQEFGFSTIYNTLNSAFDSAKKFGEKVVKQAEIENSAKSMNKSVEGPEIKSEVVNYKGSQVVTGYGYGLGSVLITTGRGSGGKGPVVYDDPDFKGTPANDEKVKLEAEETAAREAQQRMNQDLQKLTNMESPDSNYEDYPAHMEPYLRDQSAGIQDDYLKFVAQSNQRMSRALSRVNGGANYYMGFVTETQGLIGEAASLTRGATKLARSSTELLPGQKTFRPGERMPDGRIAGAGVGSDLSNAYRAGSGGLRGKAVDQLRAEFGDKVLDEYVIFYHGTSTKTPLTTETIPREVFATQDIELAMHFANRKVGKVGGGDPEISAILFTKEEFENMVQQKAFVQREISDMAGKTEMIFFGEDIGRRSDFITLNLK